MCVVDAAVCVYVHAVEAESNHESPDRAEIVEVQPAMGWGAAHRQQELLLPNRMQTQRCDRVTHPTIIT